MTDRPILFSAPMVRALLAGTKTQTRRVLKPQATENSAGLYHLSGPNGFSQTPSARIPHSYSMLGLVRFAVGDRLWVRESWRTIERVDGFAPREISASRPIFYEADDLAQAGRGKLRASIHMPRWASRLTLTVTEVRVERLHDISEADAQAEGIVKCGRFYGVAEAEWDHASLTSAVDAYALLWDHINGPGAWDANPWVSATTFTVDHQNIDAFRSQAA